MKQNLTGDKFYFKEKRKWQLALRRYVLNQNPSEAYGIYFGIDNKGFREWIELQFADELTWENFSEKWQFDHILPVSYFDFNDKEDLKMCWNYINIRVGILGKDKAKGKSVDVLAVKSFFQNLFERTAHPLCARLLEKIDTIESANTYSEPAIEKFISDRKADFEFLQNLSLEEFSAYNRGKSPEDIRLEREILKKFG